MYLALYGPKGSVISDHPYNARIWTPILVIGIECASAQIGGYTRVLSRWINHALRSASDTKAAGAAAPRVRA